MSRSAEAELELARLDGLACDDTQRTQAAVVTAGNLFWSSRRPTDAEAVLDGVEAVVTETAARQVVTAFRAAFHAGLGRQNQAIDTARLALAAPDLPGQAVMLATWGLVIGLGLVGRTDDIGSAAEPGYQAARRSFDAAILRVGLSEFHLGALLMAGDVHGAEQIALERWEESTNAPSQPLFTLALLGRVALARGKVVEAARGLREVCAGMRETDTVGWLYRNLLSLAQALAMAGDAAAAGRFLAEAESQEHPAFSFLAPELILTRAWVSAAQGATTEATTLARDASVLARDRGQFGHEMFALHTAVRFGDRSAAERLGQLTAHLDGPRADVAAAHASALAADDGDALHAVSVRWEQMGDLLTAADAEAHAVTSYLARQRRVRHRPPPPGPTGWPRHATLPAPPHPRASRRDPAAAPDRPGTRDRHSRGQRPAQPRNCRTPVPIGAHRRRPSLSREHQTWRHPSR